MKKSILVIILLVVLSCMGCSKEGGYGSEEAIERGDVVYRNGVANYVKFEQFLLSLSTSKESTIRVTGYTHEGDPIFQDLHFDGEVIHYTHDNSNDEYAGKEKATKKDACKEIIEKENTQGGIEYIEYIVSGCSNNLEYFLFSIEKNQLN
ncbi:DUF4362 domain-containing protein [Bacillus sp. JJ1566]|uniref:DUF4362 domain-containing protein n=1 Tax=Bacillus sp. JJ1566 TaxID=3122961 RepID=UPI002FFF6A7E